jgi:DNA-binding NtrC family response regulator
VNHDKERILVADDEPLYLRTTGTLLRKAGYECVCVADAHEAIQRLRMEPFDLVLTDLNMPGNEGLELLRHQSAMPSDTPMIVVTGAPTLPTAIESIRLGIADYLLKPVKYEDLLAAIRRTLASRKRITPPTPYSPKTPDQFTRLFPKIIGQSPAMMDLFDIIDRIASTDANLLITGESGTGKEVIAQTIHSHSHRRDGKFQVIDCTAIPDALFESMLFGHKKGAFTGAVHDAEGLLKQCDGGTAFFDELGELPAAMQAKLLRAVQEQTFTPVGSHTPVTVNTRFICATNRNLEAEVKANRFREDLFYRLGVIHIELPALRERGDDVLLLAKYFLEMLCPVERGRKELSDDAIEYLRSYHWPGNIRELRNAIERAVALASGPKITSLDLNRKSNSHRLATIDATTHNTSSPEQQSVPKHQSSADYANSHGQQSPTANQSREHASVVSCSRDQAIEAAEHQYLLDLIASHAGNISEAARQAGVSRQGLHKLLKKHEIQATQFRR